MLRQERKKEIREKERRDNIFHRLLRRAPATATYVEFWQIRETPSADKRLFNKWFMRISVINGKEYSDEIGLECLRK